MTQSAKQLLDSVIDYADGAFVKEAKNGNISISQAEIDSIITRAIKFGISSPQSPEIVISKLIDKYGDECLPSFLKTIGVENHDDSETETGSEDSYDFVSPHTGPLSQTNVCVERVWEWISTRGKRELLKTKSRKSALKVIEPFCRGGVGVSRNQEDEQYVRNEINKRLKSFHGNFHRILKDHEDLTYQTIFQMPIYQKLCLSARKSLIRYLQWSCLDQNISIEIIPMISGGSFKIIGSQNNGSLISPSIFYWKERKETIFNQIKDNVEYVQSLMKPVGFTSAELPIRFTGKFIGKRGSNITLLKNRFQVISQNYLSCLNTEFTLSLSILETPQVSGHRVVTVGVWMNHNKQRIKHERHTSQESVKTFSRLLKSALKVAIDDASFERNITYELNSRLPHLIELPSYSQQGDKIRARNKRYQHEKSRWRKMRSYNVRKPIESLKKVKKNKDLWPKSGIKEENISPQIVDEIKTGNLEDQQKEKIKQDLLLVQIMKKEKIESKLERRKQFLATKAARKALVVTKKKTRQTGFQA